MGAWFVVGAWSGIALIGAGYGWARWRAAGWHFADGRLAVRGLRVARVTVLAPARFRESHTVVQNVFQRRAALADLDVAFGKKDDALGSGTWKRRASVRPGLALSANGGH